MPTKITYASTGDPLDVLYLENYDMPEPDKNEALIQMIAAAVNPVDINIIQGKYPLNVESPGYEGMGTVIKVGPEVKNLKVGDHVIPVVYAGTWRTHLTLPEESLFRIPKSLNVPEGATLHINPITMYTMLKEFVKLGPGDTVIQNGANSACGVVAIQMCKAWGIKNVNIVRDRPLIDDLKSFLKSLGATYVFTEEEIRKTDIYKSGELNNPILGLNCIGGSSATSIMRHLREEGVLVTYGGMSLEPVTASTTALVFKNIRLDGFNTSRWYNKEENFAKLPKIMNEIVDMVLEGKLKAPPHVLVDFLSYKEALRNTLTPGGMIGKKFILDFRNLSSKM
ncbi:enoyl-[acyl-carrier-protein] reductase, mitochondrial-like [Diabrotica undecimpunctata]|uniref:enoyl-[acyl-carrier-protein] reductase, mitochondrial-like n=1 Tax=Diabrotica undecimpunctata TaxID=50387 RepID=UPI003B63FFC4